jgi:hypothetical protein
MEVPLPTLPGAASPSLGDSTQTVGSFAASAAPAGGATADGLAPGSVVAGRYAVGERLGSGGFGVVYRAYDRDVRREVALKVLRADRADGGAIRRFQREAALARDVTSPNLVRIFETGRSEGLVFLVLELLPGGSLRDRLRAGPLSLADALGVAGDLLQGLAVLHAAGIVHRDVKPSNLLFDANGVAKLADLGLATAHLPDQTVSLAAEGLVGTATHLAPEVILGAAATVRSDLFAVGLVLYEMLTGELPYVGADPATTALVRITQTARPLRGLRPDLPRWLAALVERLLARDPADRYASASAALADLEARRGPRGWRPRLLLAAALVLAAAVGATWLVEVRSRQFSHLRALDQVDPASYGVEAVDQRGRVLWRREGVAGFSAGWAPLARLAPGAAPQIVAVLGRREADARDDYGYLSVLDPQTGRVVRRVDVRPEGLLLQGEADTFRPGDITAVDLDHDGVDEVIATFGHRTSWPCFAVLWEPRLDRVRTLLQAGGHVHLAATADIDGDGVAELFFAGYNSVLGRYPTVMALRVAPPVGAEPQLSGGAIGGATAPGLGELWRAESRPPIGGLLWTRLLPRGGVGELAIEPTARGRRLRLAYSSRDTVELGLDGDSPADPEPKAATAVRSDVFQRIEEARRLAAGGSWDAALATIHAARGRANEVADPPLAECAARVEGEILVAAGRLAEAEILFAALAADEEASSEMAYTAATAYHLAGHLERAVDWYRRGLGPGGQQREGGRLRQYFLDGLVLALGELGQWPLAGAEIARYTSAFPAEHWRAELWDAFVRSRQSLPVGDRGQDFPVTQWDSIRYLWLERAWAQQGASRELLAAVRRELDECGETRGAVRGLEAVLLAAGGERDRALREARLGVEELSSWRGRSVVARGLLALANERLADLERQPPAAPPPGTSVAAGRRLEA